MADMVAGDTNRTLRVVCTFSTAVDVAGATATLRWRIATIGGRPGSLQTAAMTNLTPTSGQSATLTAEYLFTTGQLVPGKLTADVLVTSGGLTITSDDVLEYDIRARV